MLRGLAIHDIVLIEHVEIGFLPGLNVLTGETGAGKSILLDALGFALGRRGRAASVRKGARQGEVAAEFALAPDHEARALLEEAGMPAGDELLLRRVVDAEGRSRAFVNDRRAGLDLLRRLSDTLVEIHGQHDDRGVLDPRNHRALLDAFADNVAALSETRACWRALKAAEDALAAARADLEAAARDEDYLRHAVAELERIDPQPGEEARLDAERRDMRAAARIREDVEKAARALGEEGAESLMLGAARLLQDAARVTGGRLDLPHPELDRALDALAEAQEGVARALAALAIDPQRLEAVEERLFELRALARKHRVSPEELPGLAQELGARLRRIDRGAAGIAELE
ncbi:MAG: DNA repair protein RecN, partial [Alphaproteobacteria bacterium]